MTDNEKLDTKVETTSDNSVDSHSDKKKRK